MTTREASFDHAAEAREHLSYVGASLRDGDCASAQAVAAVAQVHATLALLGAQQEANEQARIANLIAATHLVPKGRRTGVDSWGASSDSALHSRLADEDTWIALLGADGYEREKAAALAEGEWEYAWAGEDWLLEDEVFPSPQVAENWVGLLSTRRWVREEGGYLVRRRAAGPWERVEGDGDA